ncbi:MAG: polysaccharide deacetylase family protein [Candidatus Sumerlaeota bacterium]|nr:polysaccharide deacetylase family protein [Candidatus Sumerlaeota bacterium]
MSAPASAAQTLAERLGFAAGDKVLILNGDDLGVGQAMNAATFEALETGLLTSATVMVPCAWFPEIAAYAREHPDADFGVHLTHVSELKGVRWGPVASKSDVPSLVDPDGYFWPERPAFAAHATPQEAEIEARAQIQKTLAAGIDVTHLDTHTGALQAGDRYFQVYRKLAREFDLPLRMASQARLANAGAWHHRTQLAADGVLCPDYLIHGGRKEGESFREYWKRMFTELKPGVTEAFVHLSRSTEESQCMLKSARWVPLAQRVEEYKLFTTDPELGEILDRQGVKRIGYRVIRELQRTSRTESSSLQGGSF